MGSKGPQFPLKTMNYFVKTFFFLKFKKPDYVVGNPAINQPKRLLNIFTALKHPPVLEYSIVTYSKREGLMALFIVGVIHYGLNCYCITILFFGEKCMKHVHRTLKLVAILVYIHLIFYTTFENELTTV